MLRAINEALQIALGLGVDKLTVPQMLLRTVIVYAFMVLIVRWGEKRFFGKNTAFDLVLSIILGSVISRAINGGAPFFPTLLASVTLVGLHRLLAVLAFHSDRFGDWIKGRARVLVRDGEVDWGAMEESHLTEHDLRGALRLKAQISDPSEVEVARLERSGDVSVIPREGEPRVVEWAVEDGVKVIRLEIHG
jgi:uncharacterized membrane protein YcaP (DUF421 family)